MHCILMTVYTFTAHWWQCIHSQHTDDSVYMQSRCTDDSVHMHSTLMTVCTCTVHWWQCVHAQYTDDSVHMHSTLMAVCTCTVHWWQCIHAQYTDNCVYLFSTLIISAWIIIKKIFGFTVFNYTGNDLNCIFRVGRGARFLVGGVLEGNLTIDDR